MSNPKAWSPERGLSEFALFCRQATDSQLRAINEKEGASLRKEREQRRRGYVWHGGRIRWSTGLVDFEGKLLIDDLSEEGAGYLAKDPLPVEGSQLESCRRIWGDERVQS